MKPVDGGDVVPAVENAKQPQAVPMGGGGLFGLSSDKPTDQKDALDVLTASKLNGAQVDAMLRVVENVAAEKISRESGVAILISAFGLSSNAAQAMIPVKEHTTTPAAKTDAAQSQPDNLAISDITPTKCTFEQRVAQLVEQSTAQNIPLAQAVADAIARAYLEGFVPSDPQAPPPEEPGAKDGEAVANPEVRPTEVGTGVVREPKPGCECPEGECECEQKDILKYTDGGSHVHAYADSANETNVDGDHCHVFMLADGRKFKTSIDGAHKHPIEINSDRVASGKHTHKISVDGVDYEIPESGEHYHEYGPSSTPLSGAHQHTLVLKDGTTVHSMSDADLRDQKGDQDDGQENEKEENKTSEEIKPIGHKFTSEQLTAHVKTMTGDKAEELIAKRALEVEAYWKKLESIFRKSVAKKLRKSWILAKVKAEDSDDLIDEDALEALIKAESLSGSKVMELAVKYGFEHQLADFKLGFPNENAIETIKKIGGKNIQHVTETTKRQIRDIIAAALEENVAIGEVGKRVTEYFNSPLLANRSQTIARLETLQAISVGQDIKTQSFKEEYPERKDDLVKMWLDSRDERVRGNPDGLYPDALDNHWELNGEIVAESESFSNGLKFPRDPEGGPEQIINCRCTYLTFLKQDQDLIEEAVGDEPSEFAGTTEGGKT
jgi:hypothetical protein